MMILMLAAGCSSVDLGTQHHYEVHNTLELEDGSTVALSTFGGPLFIRPLEADAGTTCVPSVLFERHIGNVVPGARNGLGTWAVVPTAAQVGVPQDVRAYPAYYTIPDELFVRTLTPGGTVEIRSRATDDTAISLAFTGQWCTSDEWDGEPTSCVEDETRVFHLVSVNDDPAVVDLPPLLWTSHGGTDERDDGSGLCGVGELPADTGP